MYKLINSAETKSYRAKCSKVLNTACEVLRRDGIKAHHVLVGSGAKNLVTRNGNAPYDLDYNLVITSADKMYLDDLHRLKETIRVTLNHANRYEFSDAHDSTSGLTCLLHSKGTANVLFSFDVAIVMANSNGTLCRLIHNKNASGFGPGGQYTWNEVPGSRGVGAKATKIRTAGKWSMVRDRYVERKNLYLERGDRDHPSFIVYIEVVNEIYDKIAALLK